jgi:hypothetical protein
MRIQHLNYNQSEKMQGVISPRKLNMCRRSPEIGRSKFERKILVKFRSSAREK